MSDVVARIDQLVANRRLLDHPFYVAWSKGELTPEALRLYARQYYQWVKAFPTWLSAAHSNASELPMRQEILENLIDEERGPENHPELWLRFCEALGLTRGDVAATEPLPETSEALAAMRQVCRETSAVAGVAALYAYETQQPEVMKTKREGLRDRYGITTGHEYFTVHETLDVEHSAGERMLIAAYAAGHEAEILRATEVAVDASNRILDGVNRCREAVS